MSTDNIQDRIIWFRNHMNEYTIATGSGDKVIGSVMKKSDADFIVECFGIRRELDEVEMTFTEMWRIFKEKSGEIEKGNQIISDKNDRIWGLEKENSVLAERVKELEAEIAKYAKLTDGLLNKY